MGWWSNSKGGNPINWRFTLSLFADIECGVGGGHGGDDGDDGDLD